MSYTPPLMKPWGHGASLWLGYTPDVWQKTEMTPLWKQNLSGVGHKKISRQIEASHHPMDSLFAPPCTMSLIPLLVNT